MLAAVHLEHRHHTVRSVDHRHTHTMLYGCIRPHPTRTAPIHTCTCAMSTTGVERASSYLTESTQTHQRAIEAAMAFKYPCEAQLRLDTKSLATAQKVDALADLVLPDDHEPVQLRLQKKLMANCDLDWLCAAGWTGELNGRCRAEKTGAALTRCPALMVRGSSNAAHMAGSWAPSSALRPSAGG